METYTLQQKNYIKRIKGGKKWPTSLSNSLYVQLTIRDVAHAESLNRAKHISDNYMHCRGTGNPSNAIPSS